MNLPKRLDILGTQWIVRYHKDVESLPRGDEGELLVGNCDCAECVIDVYCGRDDRETLGTLLHEIAHAYSEKLGLGMSEEQVNCAASLTVEFLTRNRMIRM